MRFFLSLVYLLALLGMLALGFLLGAFVAYDGGQQVGQPVQRCVVDVNRGV